MVTINFYKVTGIDELVRYHSVDGRTQNLYINSDRQPEQWWVTVGLELARGWSLTNGATLSSFPINQWGA